MSDDARTAAEAAQGEGYGGMIFGVLFDGGNRSGFTKAGGNP